jgi:hypothetical protein
MGPMGNILQPIIDKIEEGQGEANAALNKLLQAMGELLSEQQETNRLLQQMVFIGKGIGSDIQNMDGTLHEVSKAVNN